MKPFAERSASWQFAMHWQHIGKLRERIAMFLAHQRLPL